MDKRRTKDKRIAQLEALHPSEIDRVADFLKERIYASISLIALLATLWQNAEHHTPWGVALSVIGTVVALWLAIAVSSRMSYQVVSGKKMGRALYIKILHDHSALLLPAVPVLVLIAISAAGIFSLKAALFASMLVLLLSFAGFSIVAGRRIHTSLINIIVTSLSEVALGFGIIALKIVAGH